MERHITLVAGGAGFIGSHLCMRLLAEGHNVIAMDNLSTGRLSNIAEISNSPNFTFIRHDITVPYTLTYKIDFIYNLACPASPQMYQADPVKTFLTSTVGSFNLLELARVNNARILLASTSEVYGDPSVSPQAESYLGNVNPVGIRSCYDEGKRGAETLFSDYRRCLGTDIRIVRIFNTYGPRMRHDDGRVIPTFINQALHGIPLTVNGDGSQTRSFMYIDDLIDALMLMMRDGVTYLPVNLGNPEEVTINHLALQINSLIGNKTELAYRPMPADDPKKRRPDISRAVSELNGWKPKTTLINGLNNTIDYFKN